MANKKVKYAFSIIAGVISAVVLGYQQLAPVWGFPLADEIYKTGEILVLVLSMILASFTGAKLADKNEAIDSVAISSTDSVGVERDDMEDGWIHPAPPTFNKTLENYQNSLYEGSRSTLSQSPDAIGEEPTGIVSRKPKHRAGD